MTLIEHLIKECICLDWVVFLFAVLFLATMIAFAFVGSGFVPANGIKDLSTVDRHFLRGFHPEANLVSSDLDDDDQAETRQQREDRFTTIEEARRQAELRHRPDHPLISAPT